MLVATGKFQTLRLTDRHRFGISEKQYYILKARGALIEENLDPYPVKLIEEGFVEQVS